MTSANVSNVAAPSMMANPTVEKTESMDAGFSKVLDYANSMKNQVTMDVQDSTASTVKQEVTSNDSYESSKTDSSIKADKITSNQEPTKEIDSDAKEQIKEDMSDFEEEVKEILEENLSVSEEDIDSAMEVLNLTYVDLLNPSNVSQLVGQLTDVEDSIAIVIDENLSNTVSQITDAANFMLEKSNLEIPVIKDIVDTPGGIDISDMDMEIQDTLNEMDLDVQPTDFSNVQEQVIDNKEVTNSLPEKVETVEEEVKVTQEAPKPNVEVKVETSNDSKEVKVDVKPDATITVEETDTKDQSSYQGDTSNQEDSSQMKDTRTDNSGLVFNASNDSSVKTDFSIHNEAPQSQTHVDTQQVIDQIVDQAKTTITKETSTMEMILNPEHLGKVFLQVTEKEGTVKAQLHIQNQEVKEALVNQMSVLRENLEKSGVKVESIEVSVGTHEFEKNLEEDMHRQEEASQQYEEQSSKHGRHTNINMNELDDLQGLMTEEDKLIAQMMADQGNTLNYTA